MIYDAKPVLGLRPGERIAALRPKTSGDAPPMSQRLAWALDAKHP